MGVIGVIFPSLVTLFSWSVQSLFSLTLSRLNRHYLALPSMDTLLLNGPLPSRLEATKLMPVSDEHRFTILCGRGAVL